MSVAQSSQPQSLPATVAATNTSTSAMRPQNQTCTSPGDAFVLPGKPGACSCERRRPTKGRRDCAGNDASCASPPAYLIARCELERRR